MSGPGYYLPGVPYSMYFYKGYAIHGSYWHENFGYTDEPWVREHVAR